MVTQVQYAKTQSDSISIFSRDELWALDENIIRDDIDYKTEYDMKRVEICVLDMPLLHLFKSKALDRYLINVFYDKLA
jgi:hypothetical protein